MTMPTVEMIIAAPTMEGSEGLLAIVFHDSRNDQRPTSGPVFITPPEAEMQAAFMRYVAGTIIPSHIHPPQKRVINSTPEVLIIMKGSLTANLFSSDGVFQRSVELQAGDLLVLYSGGHGFTMTEETEIIEVKQGPYNASLDKMRF